MIATSVGKSGRIVIEIDPLLKQEIHKLLKSKELTLKEWFLPQSDILIKEKNETES